MNAIKVFAQKIMELPDDIEMEVSICDDNSGSITAVNKDGERIICLTFEAGYKDGNVYDYGKILTPEYFVYVKPFYHPPSYK